MTARPTRLNSIGWRDRHSSHPVTFTRGPLVVQSMLFNRNRSTCTAHGTAYLSFCWTSSRRYAHKAVVFVTCASTAALPVRYLGRRTRPSTMSTLCSIWTSRTKSLRYVGLCHGTNHHAASVMALPLTVSFFCCLRVLFGSSQALPVLLAGS